eukprot:scaffold16882_cov73-Cylindrotheca_fusiformis.AAC.1
MTRRDPQETPFCEPAPDESPRHPHAYAFAFEKKPWCPPDPPTSGPCSPFLPLTPTIRLSKAPPNPPTHHFPGIDGESPQKTNFPPRHAIQNHPKSLPSIVANIVREEDSATTTPEASAGVAQPAQ